MGAVVGRTASSVLVLFDGSSIHAPLITMLNLSALYYTQTVAVNFSTLRRFHLPPKKLPIHCSHPSVSCPLIPGDH